MGGNTMTQFRDEFKAMMAEAVPEDHREFDWSDPVRDMKGLYTVDCLVKWEGIPIFVHAVANDEEAQDATITLHQFEHWGLTFLSVVVFESQTSINTRILSQLSDVAGPQYSTLSQYNKSRIRKFLRDSIGLRE